MEKPKKVKVEALSYIWKGQKIKRWNVMIIFETPVKQEVIWTMLFVLQNTSLTKRHGSGMYPWFLKFYIRAHTLSSSGKTLYIVLSPLRDQGFSRGILVKQIEKVCSMV